jgi:L-lactate dehydrogenase complex protein LldF
MIRIKKNVRPALANDRLQKNLRHTIGHSLRQRDAAVAGVENWEELRTHAQQVKQHTLENLHRYLTQFEESVQRNGGQVVWAETGEDAIRFILELAARKGLRRVVKSKTMLGEEIRLNEGLEKAGLDVVETDLGEYIVQLCEEPPSHIVAPALHKSRREVAELFQEKLGMSPTEDVGELTLTARQVLRERFLDAELGISGVNFGIAETGTVVVVENEGNARLSTSLPSTHVALMGIEKVIPRKSDLAAFLKLLIRSSTGQKITSYVNLISGPRREGEIDGPEELFVVLVDNGRSRVLADSFLQQTLSCIRCGACQNVCPVFQRIGGHAYGSVYQGPIGAILTPQIASIEEACEHPFASSLCAACRETCPVKIEIPEILLKLRQRVQESSAGRGSFSLEAKAMSFWAWLMRSQKRYEWAGRWMRRMRVMIGRNGKSFLSLPPLSQWQDKRDLPDLPARSFRETYRSEGLEQ